MIVLKAHNASNAENTWHYLYNGVNKITVTAVF